VTHPISHDQELLDALQLNLIPGIGPRIQQSLLEAFGSPADIITASRDQLQSVSGVGPKLAQAISVSRTSSNAASELDRCRTCGVTLILKESQPYPRMLAEICDAPYVLYCRGTIEPRDELAVGIVGSRRCTLYGRQQAERIASGLARAGVTVISGLARGIDAAAHRGALAAGGRTFAVMATGLATVYPPEHAPLADEVAGQGALLTESSLDQNPVAGLFPQRNRLISGLSLGVVIVEASRRSGALHTARHAMEQGRDVFVVPGRIDSFASEGCHDLIRDGATLVRGVDDILESLGPLISPVPSGRGEDEQVHNPRELTLNEQERQVLNTLTAEPTHIDELLRQCTIEPPRVLSTLTVLEMKRMITRLPGGYLVRRSS
jgi:DNA processing protein